MYWLFWISTPSWLLFQIPGHFLILLFPCVGRRLMFSSTQVSKLYLTLLILDLICHLQRWLDPQVSAGLLCIVAGLLGDEHLLGLLGLQGGVEQWRPFQIGLALLGKFCATARWAETQTPNSFCNYLFSPESHFQPYTCLCLHRWNVSNRNKARNIGTLSILDLK